MIHVAYVASTGMLNQHLRLTYVVGCTTPVHYEYASSNLKIKATPAFKNQVSIYLWFTWRCQYLRLYSIASNERIIIEQRIIKGTEGRDGGLI
jgi:hypothetical protein